MLTEPDYSQYLMQQPTRCREVVIAGHGDASGALDDVYRLRMQYEQTQGALQASLATALEMVALTESLSGNTSVYYLRSAEELGREYESIGDPPCDSIPWKLYPSTPGAP